MGWRRLWTVPAALAICAAAWTQSPTYGVGKAPSAEELRAWDISISPTGKELPPGRGTAKEGAALYARKGCAGCHGASGYSGGHAPTLIRRKDPPPAAANAPSVMCLAPCVNDSNTMAIHSPFATTIWDYINRGMPLNREGTLTPDEVYALTAYLLFINGVIAEDQVLDQQNLAQVKMPLGDHYASLPDWKPRTQRLKGYPY